MANRKIIKIIKKYSEVLKENGFNFEAIYLFGSYAKNVATEFSDIDICVVSDHFAKRTWYKEESKLWVLKNEVDYRIQPIGLSSADLNGWSPLSHEIRTTGIKVV